MYHGHQTLNIRNTQVNDNKRKGSYLLPVPQPLSHGVITLRNVPTQIMETKLSLQNGVCWERMGSPGRGTYHGAGMFCSTDGVASWGAGE